MIKIIHEQSIFFDERIIFVDEIIYICCLSFLKFIFMALVVFILVPIISLVIMGLLISRAQENNELADV